MTIDSVEQAGSTAVIQGTTDLPNGTVLSAGIELYNSDPKSTYIGSSADTKATEGKWSARVPFPKVADFAKGPHEATVIFTPKAQPPEILDLVGNDAERVKGSKSKFDLGFSVLTADRRVKLRVGKTKSTLPKPSSFSLDDPRRSIATMLKDWKDEHWQNLAQRATLSDNSTVAERLQEVDNQLSFRKLESASIGEVHLSGMIARVNVKASYAIGSELREETMGFVLLKVDDQARMSSGGKWRVNIGAVRSGGF